MGTEPLLIFHPLTLFLVLSALWVLGGPGLAILLSVVVSNITSDVMRHPTVRMFTASSRIETSNDPNDKNMQYVMRENFVEMSRIIFLIYGAIGLVVVPTFILIFLAEIREPGEPPALGLFLTSLLNLVIVGGVIVGSHALAVILRDRMTGAASLIRKRKDRSVRSTQSPASSN